MNFFAYLRQIAVFFSLVLLTFSAHAAWQMNMPRGVTPISNDVYNLHMAALWICVGIAVVVFGVLIYSLIYHRKSRGAQAAQFHEHTTVEIAWAVIPFLILIAMAVPATKILIKMNDDSKSELTVKITGFQWKWKYEYLDQGISFFSNLSTPQNQLNNQAQKGQWYLLEVDKPLILPINRKIRFLLTANDVIHSWWVPELGIKRDALPGFINETWAKIEKPGIYRGQCAELCGTNHGFMPIVVEAVSEQDFDKWVAQQAGQKSQPMVEQKLTKEQLMAKGEEVYNKTCAVCHKTDGTGTPPVFPSIKNSKIVVGFIKEHINIVLNGKPGTAMQAFGTQLSDEEVAAVITYQRNAFGNDNARKAIGNKEDLVQPPEITAAKK